MKNPSETHWKALGRIIGYMKYMKVKGLMYVEPESFCVSILCDTHNGNCTETYEVLDVLLLPWVDVLWICQHQNI